MSGSASLGVEQAMLSHTLGIGPVAAVSRAYVALCLASLVPDERTVGREVSGNGYARLAASFQVLASPPNMAANTTTVAFPIATAPWGVLGYFELWDAPYGGNRLYWGALVDPADGTTPITLSVSAGDVLRFSAGALGVRIGPSGSSTVGGAFLPLVGGTLASPGNLTVGGWLTVTGAAATLGGPLSVTGPTALAGGATITGDSAIRSGYFTLALDPTSPMHAATKQYVDGGGAGGGGGPFLPTTGGSLNGPGNLGVGGTLGVTGNATLSTGQPTWVNVTGGAAYPTVSAASAAANASIVLTAKGTGTVTIGGNEASGNKGGLSIWSGPLQYPAFLTASGLSGVNNSTWWGNTTISGSLTDSAAGYSMVNLAQITDQLGVVNDRNVAYFNNTVRTTAQTTGSRWNGLFTLIQTAQSGNNTLGRDFGMVGLQSYALAGFNEGGTGPTATKGAAWSFLTDAELRAGATNWTSLVGYELDISVATGASASKKVGMQIVQLSTDKVHGANQDAAFTLSNQINAVGWRDGFTAGSYFAQWPMAADGTILGAHIGSNNATVPAAAAWGVDFNQAIFSSGFLRGPNGFSVDGSARVQIGTMVIAPGGATTTLDSAGQTGTGTPAIVGGGTGVLVGMTYFDPYGGVYTTSAQSGGVCTAFAAPYRRPFVNGAAPANPVTLTPSGLASQQGATNITANLTWTAGTTLSLQPSGGVTTVGGILRAPHLNMGGATGAGLSVTLAGLPDYTTSPLWVNTFFGGTNANANNQFFNAIIGNDNVSYTGNGISAVLLIRQNVQGNAKNAGGLWVESQQTQAPAVPFGFSTAITGSSSLAYNCGGTALTPGNTAGAATTLNTYTSAGPGATFLNGIVGYEMDIQAQAGSSLGGKIGLFVVRRPTDVVSGAFGYDQAIAFGAQSPTAGWTHMIRFGGDSTQIPYKSTATLISAGEPQTPSTGQALAAWGIDLQGVLFSGGFLRSIGYLVDGSGVVTSQRENISNWSLTPSAAGLAIDAPMQRASLTSIAAGGGGWAVGDKAMTANGGVYQVTALTGSAVSAITQLVPDVSASPPANPVTATPTNSTIFHVNASGLTLNLAWTAANALSLQPSGGALRLPGIPASASYANDAAAATGGVPVGQLYRNGSVLQVRVS